MKSFERVCGSLTPFIRGFTVSIAMLAGAMPAFISGQLSNHYGQLRVLALGAVLLAIGNLLECVAPARSVYLWKDNRRFGPRRDHWHRTSVHL